MAPSSKMPQFKSHQDKNLNFSSSTNSLFAASPTPRGRDKDSPGSTLFAGATPGVKFVKPTGRIFGNSNGNGGGKFGFGGSEKQAKRTLFSSAGNSSGGSLFGSPTPASPGSTTPPRTGGLRSKSARYTSPTDGDDEEDAESPNIYEDESRDVSMAREEYSDDADGNADAYNDDDDDGMEDYNNSEDEEADYDEEMNDDSIISPKKKDSGDENDILLSAVTEPGELIIRTERLMGELAELMEPRKYLDDDEDMDEGFSGFPEVSKQQEILTRISKLFLETLTSHVGSEPKGSNLHKAHYILSLLLPINHSQAPITETLRKWLTMHHPEPTKSALQTLKLFHPNCVLSPDYWEIIQRLSLRGEVQEVIGLLKKADWNAVSTDAPEVNMTLSKLAGSQKAPTERRYAKDELDIIREAMTTALRVLESCPVVGNSSYNPSTSNKFFPVCVPEARDTAAAWRIWRGSVVAAIEELGRLATGEVEEEADDGYYKPFRVRRNAFGMQKEKRTQLPSEIYKALKLIYDVFSGDRDAILATASDWKEAVVGMMVWGRAVSTTPGEYAEDEEEDEWEEEEKDVEREYDFHSDETWTIKPFARERGIKRLQRTVEAVVTDMPFNQTSAIECAVAGLMAEDFAFLRILGRYSLLVASVVVEIGGWGGWIPRLPREGEENPLLSEFDEEELDIFRSGPKEEEELQKKSERVLRRYAAGLFGVEWVDEEGEVEGWEVGVGVLSRARGEMGAPGKLLTKLELSSKSRVEKLLLYCKENNLDEEASHIAASYADQLFATSKSYGDTLYFYALSAHRTAIHTILTNLLTRTLLQSSPYPSTSELDPTLKTFLQSPGECPSDTLRFELSGYAAIRMFYDSRESGDNTNAVRALVAAIRSAGEKFDGGLWDSEWEAAVESWMVLALIGELLPFVGQRKRYLKLTEIYDVLKVLTDLEGLLGETHVWRHAEEFLKSVLEAFGKKCTIREEGMEAGLGSSWELVREGIEWEDVAEESNRADWRRGLERVSGKDLVRLVRLGLSREIAKAWLEGEE